MDRPFSKVVSIDGPSGSGKSTIAKKLAQKLNILYIDTGAMFRALGYIADKRAIPFTAGDELDNFLKEIQFEYGKDDAALIQIDGENLTEKIREHHVSILASNISKIPAVRDYLLVIQRELGKKTLCVMEGRDIGTVVFPDAFCKIFLTATIEVRAMRRLKQLRYNGEEHTLEEILKDVQKRDDQDSNRKVAPLKLADDGILVDNSEMSFEQTLDYLSELFYKNKKKIGIKL